MGGWTRGVRPIATVRERGVEIAHDLERREFVTTHDGRRSYLRYVRASERTLDLVTTFVHPAIRGRGVGKRLVERALEYAREGGFRVVPTCWFVEAIARRHPDYRDLIAGG